MNGDFLIAESEQVLSSCWNKVIRGEAELPDLNLGKTKSTSDLEKGAGAHEEQLQNDRSYLH